MLLLNAFLRLKGLKVYSYTKQMQVYQIFSWDNLTPAAKTVVFMQALQI